MLVAACWLILTGCNGQTRTAEPDAGPAPEPGGLEIVAVGAGLVDDSGVLEVHCDGRPHDVADLRGAEPGEQILLASELPVELETGLADEQGTYRLAWACEQSEARLRWTITAVGHDSGRRVDFTIGGAADDPAAATGLAVDVDADGFLCDGVRRAIGTIGGSQPLETIDFQSVPAAQLRGAQADDQGSLTLHWVCGNDQAGTTWTVTATGLESGKTGSFEVVGQAPDPAETVELTVELQESPFVCDGVGREFATISNFVPFEVVDFSSEQASGLIDGRADGDGRLPIRWQCDTTGIGKTWDLTARGVESGRTITVGFAGAAPPGSLDELAVSFTENPFACDGQSRVFATIANFLPGEFVDFSSPQASALRQGQADGSGTLAIRWQCGAGDIDHLWDLTATGASSGKTTTFRISGAAP